MYSTFTFFTTSPLDQFTIRNLLSFKAEILGNFQLSLTNIGLYLTITSLIVFMLFTLTRNYDLSTPNN